MKAWVAREKDEFRSTVVFAETAGKAKSIAFGTECLEDVPFCRIQVRRVPEMDKYYEDGKTEMDWNNPQDRIVLVKECGFYCEYIEMSECENCQAKEFCSEWEEMEE